LIIIYVEDDKAPSPLPSIFNTGAFYYPKGLYCFIFIEIYRFFYCIIGLFSAILQSSARSFALPLDQLKFTYKVLDNDEEREILQSSTVSFKDDFLTSIVYISNCRQHMIFQMVLLSMESIWMVHNGIVNVIKLWIVLIKKEVIVYHLFCANSYRYSEYTEDISRA